MFQYWPLNRALHLAAPLVTLILKEKQRDWQHNEKDLLEVLL